MYKVTLFLEQCPEDLALKLIPIGFKKVKEHLVFEAEKRTFKIIPFGDAYKTKVQGYRILSDFSIDGILSIFDRSIGLFKPKVSAVEYLFINDERTKEAWDFYFGSRPAYQIVDERGIYKRGNVSVFFGGIENALHLSIRSKQPKGEVSINKCLEGLALLLEDIRPTNVDIFTYLSSEAI